MHTIKNKLGTQKTEYISESQAASILRISPIKLRNLRYKNSDKDFIPYVRNEQRKVLYKKSDVIVYRIKPKARLEHEYPRIPILFDEAPIPALYPFSKLSTAEAALAFGISKASLQIWRSKRQFLSVLPFHGDHSDIHYMTYELADFVLKGREYWKARSIELNYQFRPHPRSGRAA